jgi:F-type H+-transporting ATPase subunit delta
MPAAGTSARRYAEAAFELAVESNAVEPWARDLETLASQAEERDVLMLLESNRVPRDEKTRLLDAVLKGQVSTEAFNLARLLVDRGKFGLARRIHQLFREMADERAGVAHATVTTAVPLSAEDRQSLADRLSQITGKKVDVTPVVDESIIGGVVARIGDQLIDGSTRSKLMALKRRLETAAR